MLSETRSHGARQRPCTRNPPPRQFQKRDRTPTPNRTGPPFRGVTGALLHTDTLPLVDTHRAGIKGIFVIVFLPLVLVPDEELDGSVLGVKAIASQNC